MQTVFEISLPTFVSFCKNPLLADHYVFTSELGYLLFKSIFATFVIFCWFRSFFAFFAVTLCFLCAFRRAPALWPASILQNLCYLSLGNDFSLAGGMHHDGDTD
jgi:hypothetical protein